MPLSSPSARPVLAALLAVLVLAAPVLAAPPATLVTGASAAGPASVPGTTPAQAPADTPPQRPAAPPEPAADAPITMELVSIDPTSLAPGGTVTAEVAVTNTSSRTLESVALQLRTRTSRVTDREEVAQWQSDASPDTSGPAISTSPEPEPLAAGDTVTLTVQASAEDLGYVDAPYYWGTRRLSLSVVADQDPLAAIRTFTVWRPEQAEDTITQSVLLPVASQDASASITAPEEYAQSAESGRLASLQQLALRGEVDWWMDPALLDPPALPVETEEDEAEEPATTEEEPTPQPVVDFAPDPAAAEIATALDEGVGERTVVSMPYARSDLTGLRAAGGETLAEAASARREASWEQAGILPRALALPVDGPQADAEALREVAQAGASAAIVPSSSLRPDLDATVTPSSVAMFDPQEGQGSEGSSEPGLPLLAPDPELSEEFSLLTGQTDTEQTAQRLLAETATIASEYTTAPRHLLIAPDPEVSLDAEAAGAVLDEFARAPWIEAGRTSALLDAAESQEWTGDTRSDSGELYAMGTLGAGDIIPSGPDEDGRWTHREEAEDAAIPDPEIISRLEETWAQLDTLSATMSDTASLERARLLVLSGTSVRWRDEPEVRAAKAEEASALGRSLLEEIEVVPASGYNLISDAAGVPITVTNGLDTQITVRTAVSSDRPLVRVGEQPVVDVPARGQVEFTVPVEAIANGTVDLTVSLTTPEGDGLTDPVEVPLTVNPAWENRTTVVVVIAMGVLLVVGVARARRTGASTRAPAVRGPEDPVELSRTGRSRPASDPGSDPVSDPEEEGS